VDQATRRARWRTTLLFGTTGFVFATWAARIPDVQQRLDLSATSLAVVFAALEAGAVVGLPLGGVLVGRIGSRACLRVGVVVFPAALTGVALASSLPVLVVVVALWAAANSLLDVALNAQGLEIERRRGRPVLSSLHAGHSLGLLAGAGLTVAVVAAGMPLPLHLALVAGGCLVVGLLAGTTLLDEPRGAPRQRGWGRPDARLLLLGAVAFGVFAIEGAATSWSAVHLRQDLQAGPALAAAGYACFAGAVAAGRLVGDRLLARLGHRTLLTGAGATCAAAVVVVVLGPTAAVVLVGWTLLGAAVAPLAPAVLGASAAVSASRPAEAVATTTTLGYLGSFTVPPVIGLVAAAGSVTAGLLLLLPAALGVALLARPALRPRSDATGRHL
jgi:MFS family permease